MKPEKQKQKEFTEKEVLPLFEKLGISPSENNKSTTSANHDFKQLSFLEEVETYTTSSVVVKNAIK